MPESVFESVLHARSVAMNEFSELVKEESSINKPCARQGDRDIMQRTENVQSDCRSVSTSDSVLSPASTNTEFSPATCHSSQTSPASQSNSCSPIAPSAVQLNIPGSVSGAQQLVPALQVVCVAKQSTQSHSSSQLKVQQQSTSPVSNLPNSVGQVGVTNPLMSSSSTDSSPASSTITATTQQDFVPSPEQFLNSISDCEAMLGTCPPYNSAISPPSAYPAEMDPMLRTASSTDSILSTDSVPFQNPNFPPQAPLNNFNPEIPSNFNFSTCNTTTSPYQPFSTQSSPFFDSAVSMPTAQPFDSSSMLISSDDSLVQQFVGGVSMDKSSLDTLAASLLDPTASMDPMSSYSPAQTNFVSNSNSSASLQDSMFCSPTHFNADFTSQTLVDSDSSTSCNLSTFVSIPEVQDILQQFM